MGLMRTTRDRPAAGAGLMLMMLLGALGGCTGFWHDPQLRPNTPDPAATRHLTQADRYLDHGLTDSALAEFGLALEKNPRLTEAHMGIGNIFRQRGNYERASRRYERVTEIEPENDEAHYYLGLTRQLMGKVQQAVQTYLRALSINPDNANANRELAAAYLQLGQAGQAIPYARRATELEANSQPAWSNLAAAYSLTGRYEQAVDAYRQALELGEAAPQLVLGLADAHVQLGNYARAINTLKPRVGPDASAAMFERLGYAHFKLRHFEKAMDRFQQALNRNNEHVAALNGLGVCLMTLYLEGDRQNASQRNRALQAWRKSVKLRPNQPRIVDLISRYSRM